MKITFENDKEGIAYAVLSVPGTSRKLSKISIPPTSGMAKIEVVRGISGINGFWTAENMTLEMSQPVAQKTSVPCVGLSDSHCVNIILAGVVDSPDTIATVDSTDGEHVKIVFTISDNSKGALLYIDTRKDMLWNYAVYDFFEISRSTTLPEIRIAPCDFISKIKYAALKHIHSGNNIPVETLGAYWAKNESASNISRALLGALAGSFNVVTPEENISKTARKIIEHISVFNELYGACIADSEWDMITSSSNICALTAVADVHDVVDVGDEKLEIDAMSFIWLLDGKYMEEAYTVTDGIVWIFNLTDGTIDNCDAAFNVDGTISPDGAIEPGGIGLIVERADEEYEDDCDCGCGCGHEHNDDPMNGTFDDDFDDCSCGNHHNHKH